MKCGIKFRRKGKLRSNNIFSRAKRHAQLKMWPQLINTKTDVNVKNIRAVILVWHRLIPRIDPKRTRRVSQVNLNLHMSTDATSVNKSNKIRKEKNVHLINRSWVRQLFKKLFESNVYNLLSELINSYFWQKV